MKKQKYLKPQIEVIHVEMEGVMALSAGGPSNPGMGTSSRKNSSSSAYTNDNGWNELDDILNDIFTVKK